MYPLNDEKSAVEEVQRFLYLLSNTVMPEIPRVSVDGIYGVETEAAVLEFQRISNLEATGQVDYLTFKKLFADFHRARADINSRDYVITDDGFPLRRNMMNIDVLVLHTLIAEIQKTYDYLTEVRMTTYYSWDTERAVSELQEIFGMEVTGEVNAEMFDRLILELDSIRLSLTDYV